MVRGSFGSRTEPARRSRHRFSPSSEEFFAAEPTSQTAPGCVRTVEPISSRKAILVTFTISKTKLAVAIIAAALTIPTSAMAFHVFDDVPDDKFYAEPVEWAFDNGITTGKTATMFAPDDAVTRGESVTFLKRYNDNVVEPAIAEVQADVDANADDIAALGPMYWASIDDDGSIIARSSGVNSDLSQTRRINEGGYEVDFDLDTVSECHAMVSRSTTASNNVSNGEVYAELRLGDSSSMYIQTSDSSGTAEDSPFTIQLWCQPADNDIVIIALGAESGLNGQGD